MQQKFTDLRCKEIINISDGCRLGYVIDVELELSSGRILALIAPGLVFFLPAPVCWLESRTIEAVFRLHMRTEDLERETA